MTKRLPELGLPGVKSQSRPWLRQNVCKRVVEEASKELVVEVVRIAGDVEILLSERLQRFQGDVDRASEDRGRAWSQWTSSQLRPRAAMRNSRRTVIAAATNCSSAEAKGTTLLTPHGRPLAEDRGDWYWLNAVTNCAPQPTRQEPVKYQGHGKKEVVAARYFDIPAEVVKRAPEATRLEVQADG